jgi:ribonuclease J
VGEIGGNKILLEDGQARIFFDFGKAFGRYGEFFDGVFLRERVSRGLLDSLSLGLIPPLRGVLRDDLVPVLDERDLEVQEVPPEGRQRKPRVVIQRLPSGMEDFWACAAREAPLARDLRRDNAPAVDLILLSHAHQDHISDLEYVSPGIPAASTRMTAFISKVLLETGPTGRSGAPWANLRGPDAQGILQSLRQSEARPWSFLDQPPAGEPGADPLETSAAFWATQSEKPLAVQAAPPDPPLPIRTFPVDHSLYGAAGFSVETSAGWVGYSGDLRFHGRQAGDSWRFADELAALGTAVLLCEGTRLSGRGSSTEGEVHDRCLETVRRAEGSLVVADFAPRNVERLQSFVEIAGETNRRLLVQPKDAYLLRAMHLADDGLTDMMLDSRLGLYDDPKARELGWEQTVRQRYRDAIVGRGEVARRPGDYLLAFSLTDIPDLLDLQQLGTGARGGLYLFSNSPAYDDEQMVDLVRLWNWMDLLGMRLVGLEPEARDGQGRVTRLRSQPGYHASGHAGGDELVEFVRRVHPEVLIPIHTETPEAWQELLRGSGIRVRQPRLGEPIPLA